MLVGIYGFVNGGCGVLMNRGKVDKRKEMELRMLYSELQALLASRFGQEIDFQYVEAKTIRLQKQVEVGALGFKMKRKVKLEMTVEAIQGSDVDIVLGGGLGMDLLLRVVLVFVKNDQASKLIERKDANRVQVHLGEIPQVKKFLDRVEVSDLIFEPEGLRLVGSLK